MKSRILFISPVNPCLPFSGIQYRTTNILKDLIQRYRVDLLFFDTREDRQNGFEWHIQSDVFERWQAVPAPSRVWWRPLKSLLSPLPHHVTQLQIPEMEELIKAWCLENRYDLIFSNTSHMFPMVRRWGDTTPILVDQIAAEPDVWDNLIRNDPRWYARWYARLNRPKIMRFERTVHSQAAGVVSITDRDREITLKHFPDTHVVVAPQGVDCDYYAPDPSKSTDPLCLIFSGTDAMRNVDAMRFYLERIHPQVVSSGLAARLLWIGNVRPASVHFLTGREDVELTGFVPDTPPYFNQGMLYIAPFRMGEGMKTKIVEAMAMGKVIFATSVAVQGIDVNGLPFIRVTDDPGEFAGHIVDLLRKPEEMVELGRQARHHARNYYSWDRTLAPMVSLIGEIIDQA